MSNIYTNSLSGLKVFLIYVIIVKPIILNYSSLIILTRKYSFLLNLHNVFLINI